MLGPLTNPARPKGQLAGVGANKGISIGNKTDLDEVDYLRYLLDDPGTGIVCLYLESIGHGPRLLDLARSSSKPVASRSRRRCCSSPTAIW